MSPAAARCLVAVVVAATAALEIAALALAAGVVPLGQPVLYAAYTSIQAVAGAIIVWHYPRHPIGWLLAAFALNQALLADAALAYGQRGYAEGWPGATQAEVVSLTSWPVGALGISLLFLLFPDGRYLSRSWRWVPVLLLLGAALAIPGSALNPRLSADLTGSVNPLATDGFPAEAAFAFGATLVCAALVASVVALLLRFRRSRGVRRRQLKWVLLAGGVLALVLPLSAALWAVWPLIHYAPALAVPLLPIAVCVAIVRRGLYDIDLIISRTVAYGALTGVLGGTYAAVVLTVGALVASPVAAAAGALVTAVTFWPVRTRIQQAVDRRFRRARYESRRVMTDFVDRLRRGEAGAEGVEDALRTAVHDQELAMAFRSEGRTYDVSGRPLELSPRPARTITSVDTGQQVIAMVRHRDADARLVADVVDAGRLALEIAALQTELRRRLKELDASRSRIVAVADEERRRLARDLHDGAQQRLVSIGLDLRHAQHALNGGAVAELSNAIDELRELASGLRPSSLNAGLGSALRELAARSPIPVEMRENSQRFPSELEAAAYFIACEALTNAVKHASAHRVHLAFARQDGELVLTVNDDGAGGADVRRGNGLLGLIDRARAHGGSVTIDSTPGIGTLVTARLPCA
jgi:signal transduction histidine kinase